MEEEIENQISRNFIMAPNEQVERPRRGAAVHSEQT